MWEDFTPALDSLNVCLVPYGVRGQPVKIRLEIAAKPKHIKIYHQMNELLVWKLKFSCIKLDQPSVEFAIDNNCVY